MKDRIFVWVVIGVSLAIFGVLASLAWDGWVSRPSPQSVVQPPRRGTNDPVLVAAGDISSCGNDHDEATAKLLDGIPGTVAALGDTVYPGGRAKEFAECYQPTWGRHLDRTYPAVGNHEYQTADAADYFRYFGQRAGEAGQGYYRYQVGEWQIFVLNSNCSEVGGCDSGSPQVAWLEQELAAYPSGCSLAYMHHPPFSSGYHGGTASLKTIWKTLVQRGVDVVLAGHDHAYERFAPLDATGQVDLPHGTREFVVGTGGRSLYSFRSLKTGSEVRSNKTYGVLKLTLHPDAYSWEFVPVAGQTFTDAGSADCR